ncbi:hypothetical protein THAOC_31788 [Thalassiosira oceanica]|uniref:Uncharacterized protein n=1 Tax=Thalassiosira oceanica TaxID=159749 RepID=K0RAK4_THAOC|nr:hypothetical protein THAOC_31788 [Thalassiosira oceanica]|eukprot:EJK49344.1 hypothetical protein THAOC_31788 [Thalassiosira oceanica]
MWRGGTTSRLPLTAHNAGDSSRNDKAIDSLLGTQLKNSQFALRPVQLVVLLARSGQLANCPVRQLTSGRLFTPNSMLSSAKKSLEFEVATGFPNCLRAGRLIKTGVTWRRPARKNSKDIWLRPAGAHQLVTSVLFGAFDAELRTKPAGPKSEVATANGPVATGSSSSVRTKSQP